MAVPPRDRLVTAPMPTSWSHTLGLPLEYHTLEPHTSTTIVQSQMSLTLSSSCMERRVFSNTMAFPHRPHLVTALMPTSWSPNLVHAMEFLRLEPHSFPTYVHTQMSLTMSSSSMERRVHSSTMAVPHRSLLATARMPMQWSPTYVLSLELRR